MQLTQFQQNNSAVIYTDLDCSDTWQHFVSHKTLETKSIYSCQYFISWWQIQKNRQASLFLDVCVHLGAIRTGAFILIYNQRENVTELLALKETLTQSRQ